MISVSSNADKENRGRAVGVIDARLARVLESLSPLLKEGGDLDMSKPGKAPIPITIGNVSKFLPKWLPLCALEAKRDEVHLFDPLWLNTVASDGSDYGEGGCPPFFIVDFQGVLNHSILFNCDLQSPATSEEACKLLIGELVILTQSMDTFKWKVHAYKTFDFVWKGDHCEPPQANTLSKPTPPNTYTVRVAARIGIKGFFVKPPIKIGALAWG
jgi:hypothetical protein